VATDTLAGEWVARAPAAEPLVVAAQAIAEGTAAPVAAGPAQRHFLFVTAPFGPFSALLARRLRAAGARCTRVLLNGGDVVDWGLGEAAAYRGARAGWAGWLTAYLRREAVTDVVVFGDTHPYAASALDEARRRNLSVHVLEEGYFRPHWITLEHGGVNGCSGLPRDPEAYRRAAVAGGASPGEPARLGPAHRELSWRIFLYFAGVYAGWPLFARFKQPYSYSPLRQGLAHAGKYLARRMAELAGAPPRPAAPPHYFLVLLQRPGDSQIVRHSPFRTVAAMIEHVLTSFARHAPPDAALLIKAHPLDHGIERHDRQIAALAASLGVAGRVTFIDEGLLPGLLGRADGVVTVNSTGGLAALEAGRPTIALGQAIYDIPGLAHQAGLDRFWSAPEAPEALLFDGFKRTVIALTQVNGAFASHAGAEAAAAGVAERVLGERG